jgi:hypothetical protein
MSKDKHRYYYKNDHDFSVKAHQLPRYGEWENVTDFLDWTSQQEGLTYFSDHDEGLLIHSDNKYARVNPGDYIVGYYLSGWTVMTEEHFNLQYEAVNDKY